MKLRPDPVMDPANDDLQHTQVVGDPGSARGLWPLLMSGLTARYVFDASRSGLTTFQPGFAKSLAAKTVAPLQAYVEGESPGAELQKEAFKTFSVLHPALSSKESETALEALRASYHEAVKAGEDAKSWGERAAAEMAASPHLDEDLRQRVGALLSEKAAKLKSDHLKTFETFEKQTLERHANAVYDLPLGVGSALLDLSYTLHVDKNMRRLFAETVAYENGKNPNDVTHHDMTHSSNAIVVKTWHNLEIKTAERVASDAPFGGRELRRISGLEKAANIEFGAIGIGVKAGMLFSEIFRHQKTTMYEDLVSLVDRKLNPEHGIGQPVTAADMASLFQKYESADKKHVEAGHNHTNWVGAEPLFEHMAALMNETYKEKYLKMDGSGTGQEADFVLPKLIYLLGHDLIDPQKPEQTRAYIDAANRPGIAAVKQLKANLDGRVPLADAIRAIPANDEAAPAAAAVLPAADYARVTPDPKLSGLAANDGRIAEMGHAVGQ